MGLVAEKHSINAQRALQHVAGCLHEMQCWSPSSRIGLPIRTVGVAQVPLNPKSIERDLLSFLQDTSGAVAVVWLVSESVRSCQTRIQHRTPAQSFAFSCFVRRPSDFARNMRALACVIQATKVLETGRSLAKDDEKGWAGRFINARQDLCVLTRKSMS